MTDNSIDRVLALELRSRNFGFVVFEGDREVLDWGAREVRPRRNWSADILVSKVTLLLNEFNPQVVVIKVPLDRREAVPVARLIRLARSRNIVFRMFSSSAVRKSFPNKNRNNYEIAVAIAERYPQLAARLPRKRKLWEGERYAMRIFAAAALGLTYLLQNQSGTAGIFSPASH